MGYGKGKIGDIAKYSSHCASKGELFWRRAVVRSSTHDLVEHGYSYIVPLLSGQKSWACYSCRG